MKKALKVKPGIAGVEVIDETALLVKVRIGDAEFWRPKAKQVKTASGCEFELNPTGKCGKQPTTLVGFERPQLKKYSLCKEHANAAIGAGIGVVVAVKSTEAAGPGRTASGAMTRRRPLRTRPRATAKMAIR